MLYPRLKLVKKEDTRPAGKPDECFYCHKPIGAEHSLECVIRTRKVKIRLSTEMVLEVPESWEEENINFYLNESSSCMNSRVRELLRQKRLNHHQCWCGIIEGEYIGEISE